MSDILSLFESTIDEWKQPQSKRTTNTFNCAEILFELFPSIFMPYLDVYTFCDLLKTDLWNWHHLLSDRIVFDFCQYISRRNEDQINAFCKDCDLYESAYDSSDSNGDDQYHFDDIKYIEDEQHNFAVLRLITDRITEINDIFIFNNFKDLDIIRDRMWLTPFEDIGLKAHLCKNVIINKNNKNKHNFNKNNDKLFVYDTFHELRTDLQYKHIYSEKDLECIRDVVLVDILSLCVIKWYFIEWHQAQNTFYENNQCFKIIRGKQKIIGHLNHDQSRKQELFVVWSFEWQYTEEIK